MDCVQAQEVLLGLDRPADADAMPPALREHLASCPLCRAYAARLVRMEAMVAGLEVSADSAAAKEAFAARLRRRVAPARPQPVPVRRRIRWQPLAAAAAIVLAVGLALYLVVDRNEPAQAALDQLVQLNLQLAQTPGTTERARIYDRQKDHFRRWLARRDLTAEQKMQATALLDNCHYLARHADPLDEAEGFSKLSQLLLDQDHAPGSQSLSAERLHRIERIRREGIAGSLKRFRARGHASDQQSQRAEAIQRSDQAVADKLKALLDRPGPGQATSQP